MRGRLSTDCLTSGGIGCISNRKGNTEMITIRKKETVYFINIVTSLPEALEAHTHRLLWDIKRRLIVSQPCYSCPVQGANNLPAQVSR